MGQQATLDVSRVWQVEARRRLQDMPHQEARVTTNTAQLGLQLEPDPPKQAKAGVVRSFHNQGGAPTVEVALEQNERNVRQEDLVLAFLRAHPRDRYTVPEVALAVGIKRENSAARALTNLKNAGLVKKHKAARRMGSWGTDVCTWSLAEPTS